MSPKAAIKILAMLLVIIVGTAGIVLFVETRNSTPKEPKQSDSDNMNPKERELQAIIDKKQNNQGLSQAEQAKLDQAIQEKVKEKWEQIENKPSGDKNKADKADKKEGSGQKYTPKELEFMANPEKTIRKEMGLENS